MTDKIRLFPNGFLFTQEEGLINIPSHYKKKLIQDKYKYYYDATSRNRIYIKEDSFIIIHGLFVHIDLQKGNITWKSPELLLNSFKDDYEEFLNSLDYLGGRFAIIIGDKNNVYVYPDATGSRTVYYSKDFKSIASHSKLLSNSFGIKSDPLAGTTYDYRTFFDYSLFNNVESLIPNFYLDLNSGKKSRFFPRKVNKYTNRNEKEKINIIEFLWKNQLKHFVDDNEKLIFSLTGGADSRLSLAMARDYINDIESFTYTPYEEDLLPETAKDEMLYLDKLIVNQLLENFNFNHKFLYFRDENIFLNQDENKIIQNNTVRNHGKGILPYYIKSFKGSDIIHIRANLLEIGRAYYITDRTTNSSVSIKKNARHKLLKGVKPKTQKHEELERLIDLSTKEIYEEKPLFDYHLLDLYYWENRMGRWMSEVLNETDVVFETLLPFNMRAIIEISLSYNLKQRKTDYLFNELINKNHAILNFFGKNTTLNLYEKNKEKKDFFNSFNIYDQDNNLISTMDSIDNLLYIPKEYIQKNHYSETSYTYKNEKGTLLISIDNGYLNLRAENYLKYDILLNDKIILTEDIALWKNANHISISALKKDDKIKIRVTALKNNNNISWEIASKTYVMNIEETPTKIEFKPMISSSSPFSKYRKKL